MYKYPFLPFINLCYDLIFDLASLNLNLIITLLFLIRVVSDF